MSASLPENESPADLTPEIAEKLIDQKMNGADSLGKDPQTGSPIYVLCNCEMFLRKMTNQNVQAYHLE